METRAYIENEDALERALATPYPELVAMMRRLDGDILILGASGKMGPSLARLATNACREAGVAKRIVGVSRFSDAAQRAPLERAGVETIACDLVNAAEVQHLPQFENVIFMVGRKFGAAGSEALTWAANVAVPRNVLGRFRDSRIVAFSTGCVYALVPVAGGGSVETDPLAPVGDYAKSCVERERVFEAASREQGARVLLFRLNYAVDLRYGVLVDIAQDIFAGKPVNLSVAAVNVIWQGDANNRALLCLEHVASPAAVLNVTGPEMLLVEDVAREFGRILNKPPAFTGSPAGGQYLSNAARSVGLFGPPKVSAEILIRWVADWVRRGGRTLNKPTHFQVTDGQYLTPLSPAKE